jgi:hypothetical protein
MRKRLLAAAIGSLGILPAYATSEYGAIDFGLHFSRERTTLDYAGGVTAQTAVERATLTWYEPVGARLELGMFGGYSLLTQDNRALTTGAEARGYHAGLGLRSTVFDSDALRVTFDLSYAYERVEFDDDPDQSLTLSWYTPQAQLGVAAPLGNAVLRAGATVRAVDGQERARGTVDATTDFDNHTRTGAFAGVELKLRDGGYVGVSASGGDTHTVRFYFARRYF